MLGLPTRRSLPTAGRLSLCSAQQQVTPTAAQGAQNTYSPKHQSCGSSAGLGLFQLGLGAIELRAGIRNLVISGGRLIVVMGVGMRGHRWRLACLSGSFGMTAAKCQRVQLRGRLCVLLSFFFGPYGSRPKQPGDCQ